METKVCYSCTVKFEDGVLLEYRRDTMQQCIDRVPELLEKHGPIKLLLINKFEAVA